MKINLNLNHPLLDENGNELEITSYADLVKALDIANATLAQEEAFFKEAAGTLAMARAFKLDETEALEDFEVRKASLKDAEADRGVVFEANRSVERYLKSLLG